jgi:hypothetical protein
MIGGALMSVLLLADVSAQSSSGGGVKGRVRVDSSASTPAGVTVIVRQGEQEVKQGETNSKGEFEIKGLEPGRYGITFRKPGLSVGRLEDIEVRPGKTNSLSGKDLYLPVDDGSIAFIRGSVFDTNGRVVPGARVEIALVRPDGTEKKLDGRLTTESGLFVFRLAPERAVYRVIVKANGMETATKEVTIEGAARTNVALTLQPAAK